MTSPDRAAAVASLARELGLERPPDIAEVFELVVRAMMDRGVTYPSAAGIALTRIAAACDGIELTHAGLQVLRRLRDEG